MLDKCVLYAFIWFDIHRRLVAIIYDYNIFYTIYDRPIWPI